MMQTGTKNEDIQKSKVSIDGKSCRGEFCEIGRSLHLEKDLELPNMNQDAVKWNIDDERIQERERAARMAQLLLSKSEMTSLEESGKLIDLRIVNRINPIVFQTVSLQSIVTAHKEHRVALAEISHAEGKGLVPRDKWNSYLNALISSRESCTEKEKRPRKVDRKSTEIQRIKFLKKKNQFISDNWQSDKSLKKVTDTPNTDETYRQVCGICGNVYKLLDRIRFLLSEPGLKEVCNYDHLAKDEDQERKKDTIFFKDCVSLCKTQTKLNNNNDENYYDIRFSNCNHYMSFSELKHMIINRDKTSAQSSGKVKKKAIRALSSFVAKERLKTKMSETVPKFNEKKFIEEIQDFFTSDKLKVDVLIQSDLFIKALKEKKYDTIVVLHNKSTSDLYEFTNGIRWQDQHESHESHDGAQTKTQIIMLLTDYRIDKLQQIAMKTNINAYFVKIPLERKKILDILKPNLQKKEILLFIKEKAKMLSYESRNRKIQKPIQTPTKKQYFADEEEFREQNGEIEVDQDTKFIYSVLDSAKKCSSSFLNSTYFNLVVCHDIFDTLERLKILLKPIAMRYPGLQILLWNYPGQAYTAFKDGEVLNNQFHSKCLNALMHHVGPDGRNEFNTMQPYFLMGIGNGACVALFYAAVYQPLNLRGLLIINGFSFVDPHYASILHDCRNIFHCSPETRPDLPVYFYARYLFSACYLKTISAPLALNLYTAVHNPITLKGRIQLCSGALDHVDVRSQLDQIVPPIITVHGKYNNLVRLIHAEIFADGKSRSTCQNMYQAFHRGTNKSVIVIVEGGHELFQEKKNSLLILIEQIVTGFHETHNVPVSIAIEEEKHSHEKYETKLRYKISHRKQEPRQTKEESNLFNTLGNSTNDVEKNIKNGIDLEMKPNKAQIESSMSVHETLSEFQHSLYEKMKKKHLDVIKTRKRKNLERKVVSQHRTSTIKWDLVTSPVCLAPKRQANYVPKVCSRIEKENKPHSDVREFMSWRLKRDKKRLSRLDNAAEVIQRACRTFIAISLVKRLRFQSSTITIQRCYRGNRGRKIYREKKRELWAALFTQRSIRGHLGRLKYCQRRKHFDAQIFLAKQWRGFRYRKLVKTIIKKRFEGAMKFQSCWRRHKAQKITFLKRIQRNASVILQKLCRGHLGRKSADRERQKYIFSRSRDTGIELGRQMLMEHKLNGTNLLSQVNILKKQKLELVNDIDFILEEISELEEGVGILEKEMHRVTQAERENRTSITCNTKYELREQKMRLDQEFSLMMTKISERKKRLTGLEEKIGTLESEIQTKKHELRSLEQKLVILLEAQQTQLREIKRKRENRQSNYTSTENAILGNAASSAHSWHGPSEMEKQKAAQLMESTETMMKFGFMSMSMTYFSSLNMVKAMKTVSAQDTIMAAVSKKDSDGNAENLIYRKQFPLSNQESKSSTPANSATYDVFSNEKVNNENIQTDPQLDARNWNVDEVAKWLKALSLSQYTDIFREGAVDGTFLYVLTDDDLQNTLGVQHKLHRKKILYNIQCLKTRSFQTHEQTEEYDGNLFNREESLSTTGGNSIENKIIIKSKQQQLLKETKLSEDKLDKSIPNIPSAIEDLFLFVRHQKYNKLKDALQSLTSNRFDEALLRVQYANGYGTAYTEPYELKSFHMNKTDEYGNNLLHIAAQNGNIRIAKLLLEKGTNPNHQNKLGQTPGHFAVAYNFFNFASWLFDSESGANANDEILNIYGLGPYDGLSNGNVD